MNCKYQAEIFLETEANSSMSDVWKVLEMDDIFRLLKISAGCSKYFVHALHDASQEMRLFLVLYLID
jgi:hypothetical protein